jgi:hypothetical protein
VRVCPVAAGSGGTGTSISGPRPSPASVPPLCVGFVTFDRCSVQPHTELEGPHPWMDPSVSAAVLAVRYGSARARPPCFPQFASTGTGWHATSTPGGCPSLTAPRRVDLTASLRPRVTDVNGVGGNPCLITDATKR